MIPERCVNHVFFQTFRRKISQHRMVARSEQSEMYLRMKELQRQLEILEIQEGYIKDETKNLKREMIRAKEEIRRVQSVPLVIGQFSELIDAYHAVVSSTAGSNYFVRVLSTLSREELKPNCSVALHRGSHAVVDICHPKRIRPCSQQL